MPAIMPPGPRRSGYHRRLSAGGTDTPGASYGRSDEGCAGVAVRQLGPPLKLEDAQKHVGNDAVGRGDSEPACEQGVDGREGCPSPSRGAQPSKAWVLE
jgi:hypothetical protein